MKDIRGLAASWALGNLSVGSVSGVFSFDSDKDDILNSFMGIFNGRNIDLGTVNATKITSDAWEGTCIGIGLKGKGFGVSYQITDYKLIEDSVKFTSGKKLRKIQSVYNQNPAEIWNKARE